MSFFIRFKLFLDEIEQTKYYRIIAGVIGVIILIFGLLFYMHSNKMARLQQDLKGINRNRQKARELLELHKQVTDQQEEVTAILAQDKTFKIQQAFSKLLDDLRLQSKLTKNTEVSEPQNLNNGYSEIRLDASFASLTMQELVKLLYTLESEYRRIYIKDLDIKKSAQGNFIDVTLVIATLQPNVRA